MNSIIAAAAVSWLVAQFAKILFGLMRYGSSDKNRMVWRVLWAGGMPSAHSAVITSSTLVIYLSSGAQSSLFGLVLVMAFIVVYDRSRMYTIYMTFQNRYPFLKHAVQSDPILKDLVGHRLSEILTGIFIGLGSAFMVFKLM